jgi:hypothetical protein
VRGESVERDRLRENKEREGYERKSYESEKKREERCQSSDVKISLSQLCGQRS